MHIRAAARLAIALSLLAASGVGAEPDEAVLGKGRGYPVGTASSWYGNPYRVGSWSAMDTVAGMPIRNVARGSVTTPLPVAAQPANIRYRYRNIGYTLDEYLERQRITGLLVIRNGEIVAERYRYGRGQDARFLSFSMAKSVTSMLVGIALERGVIASLDDTAQQYAKELAGSGYGATTVRQLLRMSSGLTFSERYDGNDDVARMSRAAATGRPPVVDVLRSVGDRHSPPGDRFVYASAETEVLGRVLAGASGRSLSDLTSQWLWQPLGAERDAFWVLSQDGQERSSGFFNASLRDWGRLGWMLARDGRVGDRQVVAREYILDATDATRQPAAFQPRRATPYFGYGYQFWLFPMRERSFGLQGVHGQAVFVQPSSGIVMVQTAVQEAASGQQDPQPGQERDAFWRGVLESLGGRTE
ncbi:MAG: class beta-lactamase-related serine hydrolase [Ramlibacter sp.]|jgi:CubicO group peptidase (beta-lactamase class C family)|nr:class beta-lactamase-related serine hydrolase [Ramlibacter sp.]